MHLKKLLRVGTDLYYTNEQIKMISLSLKQYFSNNDRITVIEFKELLKISRKHAIDLLEYFDSQHLTIRDGNHRTPGLISSQE